MRKSIISAVSTLGVLGAPMLVSAQGIVSTTPRYHRFDQIRQYGAQRRDGTFHYARNRGLLLRLGALHLE